MREDHFKKEKEICHTRIRSNTQKQMNNKLIMNVELDGENETLERKGFLTSKKKWQSRAQNSPRQW